MPRKPPGALWMGDWLRARRERLRLSRATAVRRGQVAPAALSLTQLVDFECGDRLPGLLRVPALASALGIPPRDLSDWILLAPRIEAAATPFLDGLPAPVALVRARALAAAGEPYAAIAFAEWAARGREARTRQEARLTLAASLVVVGVPGLASSIALQVLERPLDDRIADEARIVIAEALLAEGRSSLARYWLEPVLRREPPPQDESLDMRLELLRVVLGGEGRERRQRRMTEIARRAERAGQVGIARRALGADVAGPGPKPVTAAADSLADWRPLAGGNPRD